MGKEKPKPMIEQATLERLDKAAEVEVIEPTHVEPSRRQRVLDAPLDRLWKAGTITQREYDAGDKYRADAYLAAVDPAASTVDWNRTGGGFSGRVPDVFTSQVLADARIRWRRINERIPERSVVATMLHLGLIMEQGFEEIGRSIFGHLDSREAVIAARAGFRITLASLADSYER